MRQFTTTLRLAEGCNPDDPLWHWTLQDWTDRKFADSSTQGDKLPFSSTEAAVVNAAKTANRMLWLEKFA